MTESTNLATEDKALQLLASLDWKPLGKQLMANWGFDHAAADALKHDLSKDVVDGLGLEFIGSRAYMNAAAEGLLRIEGLALNVCKNSVGR